MLKDWQWTDKSLRCIQKQSHENNLIGLCKNTINTFYTSSQDKTIRLWDIRLQSSIKLIRNIELTQQLSNPISNYQNQLFIGCNKNMYKFDIRKQHIFIQQYQAKTKQGQQHYDNINQIVYSQKYREILCCDDQGDIRSYSTQTKYQINKIQDYKDQIKNQIKKQTKDQNEYQNDNENEIKTQNKNKIQTKNNPGYLQCKNKLQQQHINICNCVEYIYSQNKLYNNKKLCISGGYDSTLIIWDILQQKPIKKIPILDILHKYGINTNNQDYPFIHTLYSYGSSILVGIQSGFVLCIPLMQPKKPKFILQANLTRVTDCIVANMMGKNIMITSAIDKSFSLFDYQQRTNGQPNFLQKYATAFQPTQVEVVGSNILAIGESPILSIYQIKG